MAKKSQQSPLAFLNGATSISAEELRQELLKNSTSKNGLIGRFFHSFSPNGEVRWQGYIVDEPQPGTYLVQLLEWLMGEPSNSVLVAFSDMKDWRFYRSVDSMRDWYSIHGDRLHRLAQQKVQTAQQQEGAVNV